ncbi:CotH kinase family protein [Paenibacillus sp. 1781tsa1]|nr:CotH kinase family protein [Paenibacillus sp. 1781tsa1]
MDRTRLRNFIQQLNTKSRLELFRFLQSRMDTDNYLRWLSEAVLTGNFDRFHQNYTWYEKIKSGMSSPVSNPDWKRPAVHLHRAVHKRL